MAEENGNITNGGGEQTPFYDSWGLSDEDKGYLQAGTYADAASVVKALRDTKAYVGADKNTLIKVPKADKDGNVDYTEVYKALGRPEKAEDYKLGDDDFAKAAATKLFELGLTAKQAEGLAAFMAEQDATMKKSDEDKWNESVSKGIEALKKEWGADYEVRRGVAEEAVRDIVAKTGFTQEELDKVEQALGTDKATKLFFAIGDANGGVKNLQNYNAGQETPEIAAYKLKEMLADKEVAKLLAQKDQKTQREIKRLTEISMRG